MDTFSSDFWAPGIDNKVRRRQTDKYKLSATRLVNNVAENSDTLPFPDQPPQVERSNSELSAKSVQSSNDEGTPCHAKKPSFFQRLFKDKLKSEWDEDEADPFDQPEQDPSSKVKKKPKAGALAKHKEDEHEMLGNGINVVSLKKKYGIIYGGEDSSQLGFGATAVVRLAYKLVNADEDPDGANRGGSVKKERKLFAIKVDLFSRILTNCSSLLPNDRNFERLERMRAKRSTSRNSLGNTALVLPCSIPT